MLKITDATVRVSVFELIARCVNILILKQDLKLNLKEIAERTEEDMKDNPVQQLESKLVGFLDMLFGMLGNEVL